MSEKSKAQPQSLVKLVSDFSDIGKVHHATISDGINDFPCQYITIANRTHLYKVDDNFYVDFEFDFQKLSKELIKKFKLEKHFAIDEVKPIKTRKRKKK